jgi:hypothetical protein
MQSALRVRLEHERVYGSRFMGVRIATDHAEPACAPEH